MPNAATLPMTAAAVQGEYDDASESRHFWLPVLVGLAAVRSADRDMSLMMTTAMATSIFGQGSAPTDPLIQASFHSVDSQAAGPINAKRGMATSNAAPSSSII